jgi:hypothetical protein
VVSYAGGYTYHYFNSTNIDNVLDFRRYAS